MSIHLLLENTAYCTVMYLNVGLFVYYVFYYEGK